MFDSFKDLFISTSLTVVHYVSFLFRRQWPDIAVVSYNAYDESHNPRSLSMHWCLDRYRENLSSQKTSPHWEDKRCHLTVMPLSEIHFKLAYQPSRSELEYCDQEPKADLIVSHIKSHCHCSTFKDSHHITVTPLSNVSSLRSTFFSKYCNKSLSNIFKNTHFSPKYYRFFLYRPDDVCILLWI